MFKQIIVISLLIIMAIAIGASSWEKGGQKPLETGIASWYGMAYHGNETASGEVFNMFDYTAAHRTLPFGTMVIVYYPRTGKAVAVRINDRGPFVSGRIIDLSYAAARQIDLIKRGIDTVELYEPYGS